MGSNCRPILLADDNADDAELVRRAFRKNGFENSLHHVLSGYEAINYMRGEGQYANRAKFPRPHLLLLNPNMPGTGGWEVLQWVRQRSEFNAVIVIMFGGSDSPAEATRARELGANAHHSKPAAAEEFDQLVNQIGQSWLRPSNSEQCPG
jgi:CheY-like chemotaxis protein